ncbi:hypothetical protein INT44_008045 [Umbelopsis vinacea]|uniref:AB hydrolase-1 domain-containing protein n=1 Tax=Umbelopsis vinacea TaxID=44442 RepID=A0A8H7UF23_9FUNG|nr:hypothetical protein INT44_008045 [Umbelopsis vinacea]
MTSKLQAFPFDSTNVPAPEVANHMSRSPFPESSMSTPVPSSSRNKHPSNARTRTLDRDESDAFFSTPASQAMPTINSRLLDNSGLNPYPAASPPTKHASRRMTSDSEMKSRRSKLEILNDPLLHQTFFYQARETTEDLFPSHLVGFAEYGNPDGHAVILIGGLGCSRLVGVMFHDISKRYGVRLIIPERMGYGLTEACSSLNMTVLQWADVVIQLADHLRIKRFSLIGQSVGAVFSLAVAKKYPNRVVGTVHLISPWVPTAAANTFKWTKRLPGGLMTRTLTLGMDAMWTINKVSNSPSANWLSMSGMADASQRSSTESSGISRNSSMSGKMSSATSPTSSNFHSALMALEEDELLASLDDDYADIPTDFPPHRPLRHMVRLQQMSLFLGMNKMRMAEPSSEGQTNDVLVALEKYHTFGFSFSDIDIPVSVVWGDKDNLIPLRGIEWMASTMKDVRVKVLEGEAHDLVWKEGVMEWALRGILASTSIKS